MKYGHLLVIAVSIFFVAAAACATGEAEQGKNAATPAAAVRPTPSKAITAADIAKLKWIEGTWRGMDGEKPFFERYRFDGTTMIVETLTDETLAKVEDTSRFELKDGEFGSTQGERRSAASSITADAVQFVPAAGGGNDFRFERQTDGTWHAVLEWVDKEKKPQKKIYKMEPWPKTVKP
jgi:hypothetical protein